ncbi:MurR/RpiR family transcriptional regulator [Rhizobium sp. L51/94]|uniref:MurR/RpiR family transcriptional regulator n=1 Tax=Rhizobium sp. L51/94 TaxID=2819999 RepID=UPI001C5A65F7|nr:MurR/RpiR family transcriptional regulator [Rhizobium sp. L51/94]QXZ80506.1 MurR/RpiR family transcriptional regulator [Rhizobium sp. L51/94]
MTPQAGINKPVAERITSTLASCQRPPRDLEELRQAIAGQYEKLPKRLARVARQIMDSPVEVALGSVASIAASAQVAPSTLIRFAQLLGFDGFSALQEIVLQAVRGKLTSRLSSRSIKTETELSEPGKRLLHDAIAAGHLALETMSEGISADEIETASRILTDANCIFIFVGKGMLPVASFIRNCLTSVQIRSVLVEDGRTNDVIDFATNRDAAIAIGRGEFAEGTSDVRKLKQLALPLIVFTDSEFSPLAAMASVSFNVIEAGEGGVLRITAAIALSEALAMSTGNVPQRRVDERR